MPARYYLGCLFFGWVLVEFSRVYSSVCVLCAFLGVVGFGSGAVFSSFFIGLDGLGFIWEVICLLLVGWFFV